ncbi:MAG: phosphoribosylformimino-5-aminoimidazole carboxamide ribotide isomerase [Planctomycetota bacterium]|nr:MAG: phosphoribosylformimino-5-aminoimidazole carboxamide ribotide isomerase [Planctomycetota bacterium]
MFRPCIDVKGNKVVQLEQGERLALTDKRAPLEIAEVYFNDSLTGGHMIDLEGGKSESVILPALKYNNLQFGGGVNIDNAFKFLDAGATHVIFSSFVFDKQGEIRWDRLKELKDKIGKERIVLAPDVKNDRNIYVNQWKTCTNIRIDENNFLSKLEDYCNEFLVHSIEVEGMEGGIDLELVKILRDNCSIPVTYAGGGNNLEIVETLHVMGVDITIGKAYFNGTISHDSLIEVNRKLIGKED